MTRRPLRVRVATCRGLATLAVGSFVGCVTLAAPRPAMPARGFVYYNDTLPEGPWSVHVVVVDRSKPNLEFHTTLGRGTAIGLASLSEQMAQIPPALGRPVAAVNGDYYRDEGDYEGDPKGLQIVRGELVSAPCGWTAFWIDAAGRPQLTNVVSQFEATWSTGERTPFGLNEERAPDAAVLYTAAVGASTRTRNGLELVLERDGTSEWLPLRAGLQYRARVQSVREAGDAPLTPDTMVLSLGSGLVSRTPRPRVGDRLRLSTGTLPALPGVTTAIGGGPALVRAGQGVPRDEVRVRNPRTAVGWDDQFIYLVQVDGRHRHVSEGMTTEELSNYLVRLGCHSAMSLDGGGSATSWVLGLVMNRPSEGFERAMANALVLVQKRTAGPPPATP